MYCRECGTKLTNNSITCVECGTKRNEGFNFCQMCGFHTTLKTSFCAHCGAKQQTIISQKTRNTNLVNLQKHAKLLKTFMNISMFFIITSIIAMVVLFIILEVRPEPDNIPSLSGLPMSSNGAIHDFMRYGDEEVQNYWQQGRELIGYIFLFFWIFISSLISFIAEKIMYKKTIKSIKEAK